MPTRSSSTPASCPSRHHAEAVSDPVYGAKWRAACDDDIKGKYTILKTWELVESIPTGRRAIKGKWVFSVKYKPDGSIEKFKVKARYVGCDYSQIQGLDYVDSFCSTLRLESLPCFLCGGCLDDDDLLEVDVVKAFPSAGDWDGTEIYLQQPPGYEEEGYAACRLLQPLEGTKQAGKLWMTGNAKTIASFGFERCAVEPNVWRKITPDGTMRLAIYMDNVGIRFPRGRRDLVDTHFIKPYGERYSITIVGEPKVVLGIEILRDRGDRTMLLTQTRYIDRIFTKFCSECTTKDFTIPVHQAGIDAFHHMLPGDEADRIAMGRRSLLELLGSLLWLWATATRPEIDFYVSWLCQFMSAPKLEHYQAGLSILSYLHCSRGLGIKYSADRPALKVYTDSSWGHMPRDFFGYAIILGGAAITACANRVKLMTKSTHESELYAYAMACKGLRFMQQLLEFEFNGYELKLLSPVHTDSAGAIPYIKQSGATARTRHYEKIILYGREQCLNLISKPVWVAGTDQMADIFTNALDKTSFLRCRGKLLSIPGS